MVRIIKVKQFLFFRAWTEIKSHMKFPHDWKSWWFLNYFELIRIKSSRKYFTKLIYRYIYLIKWNQNYIFKPPITAPSCLSPRKNWSLFSASASGVFVPWGQFSSKFNVSAIHNNTQLYLIIKSACKKTLTTFFKVAIVLIWYWNIRK